MAGFNMPPGFELNDRLPGEGPGHKREIVLRFPSHVEIEGPYDGDELEEALEEIKRECPQAKVSVRHYEVEA